MTFSPRATGVEGSVMGHHTVPQRYLRNFEDPNRPEFIWLHDRPAEESRQVPIKKVLQQRQFYPDQTERHLANEIELPANKVIEKLNRGAIITPVERLTLATYIGAMLRRVPYHRGWARGLVPGALNSTLAKARREIQALADSGQAAPELIERRFREVDQFEERCSRETPPEVIEKINDPIPSVVISNVLLSMTWRVLDATGPQYFATSDNPFFYFRGEGYGLGNALSEFSFSLSTKRALHGSFQPAAKDLIYLTARQRTVREINRRLVSQAERIVLYHQPAHWLFPLLKKQNLYLSRIEW